MESQNYRISEWCELERTPCHGRGQLPLSLDTSRDEKVFRWLWNARWRWAGCCQGSQSCSCLLSYFPCPDPAFCPRNPQPCSAPRGVSQITTSMQISHLDEQSWMEKAHGDFTQCSERGHQQVPAASSPAQHSLPVWEHWDSGREKLWMEPSRPREMQGFKYILKKTQVC